MEQRNRTLAEELERSNREHAEQMRLILERLDDVSTRLRDAEGPNPNHHEVSPGGTSRAEPSVEPANVENSVPDSPKGQFAPNTMARDNPHPGQDRRNARP